MTIYPMLGKIFLLFFIVISQRADAQVPSDDVIKGAFGGAIEAIIIEEIKSKVVEKSENWGNKVNTPFGKKKDGLWRRFRVKAESPESKVDFKITKVEKKTIDTAYLEMRLSVFWRGDARAQLWIVDVLSGDVDAEARGTLVTTVGFDVKLKGDLESAEFSLEPTLMKSEVDIRDFVLDRIGSIGGYSARVIGDILTKLGEDRLKEAKSEMAEEIADALKKIAEDATLRIKLRDFLK
jgi:hypothetical protein